MGVRCPNQLCGWPATQPLKVKFYCLMGIFCLFVCCSCFFQILKLEIEKVAAQRSFLFLWCGSHEGLNEGRKVCKVLKLILWKNSISYGGFIVKNLLEPSSFSVRDYAKSAKMSPALRNLNFSKELPQTSPQIDSDFVFYWFYSYLFCIFFILYYPINIFYSAHRLY